MSPQGPVSNFGQDPEAPLVSGWASVRLSAGPVTPALGVPTACDGHQPGWVRGLSSSPPGQLEGFSVFSKGFGHTACQANVAMTRGHRAFFLRHHSAHHHLGSLAVAIPLPSQRPTICPLARSLG